MISNERIEELERYFWGETNEEETQEWREDLNEEEEALISKWDKQCSNGMLTLCKEILKHNEN